MMKTDELLTSRVRSYFTTVKFLSHHRVCLCSAAGNRFISDVFGAFKRFYNLGGERTCEHRTKHVVYQIPSLLCPRSSTAPIC